MSFLHFFKLMFIIDKKGVRAMYCRNCGTKLEDTDKHCPNCGEPVESTPTFVEVRRNDEPIEDVGSFGWVILGFFIPIAGLILFCVWNSSKPKSAKQAGIGALVSVILNLVVLVPCIICSIGSMGSGV